MSVLRNLKSKLQNVQGDIKASFQALSLGPNESKTKPKEILVASSSAIDDAGADLLNIFQSYWATIHQNSEENATKAGALDKDINILLLFLEKQSLKFQQLSTELGHVRHMNQDIQNLHGSLAKLEESFRTLENQLEELDDICEEVDLRKNCRLHQEQLRSWEQSRAKEMQDLKVSMSQEHVRKVQSYEHNRFQKMREKQEAYQEAFQSDIDEYLKHGRLERTPSTSSDGQLKIDDIEIDPGNDAELEQFLEVEPGNLNEDETQDNEEGSNDIKIIGDEDITPEREFAMKYQIGASEDGDNNNKAGTGTETKTETDC